MSEVLKAQAGFGSPRLDAGAWSLKSYLPAALPVVGSFLLLFLRIQFGKDHFIDDSALMMIALACYLTAATFHLLNLYAPSNMAQKLGLWLGSLGVFFNFSSWLVRWVAARDREIEIFIRQGRNLAELPWVFRYIPFANLYDLSLAFAFGAGITTMLISGRKNYRFLGAFSLPLAALILVLARFIGSELINLQPVLDSYWRPIHVGIASLSYGVALVCFAAAVIYLLKDGVKPESMAIWAAVFGLAVFATVSRYSVFWPSTFGTYTSSTVVGESHVPLDLRADIPYVGWLLALAGLTLLGVIVAFIQYLRQQSEQARVWGHHLLRLSLIVQALAIGMLVYQVKTMNNVLAHVDTRQYEHFSTTMLRQEMEQQQMPGEEVQAKLAQYTPQQLNQMATNWVAENGALLKLSMNANPVELSALITVFVATLFVFFFSIRTDKLRASLPSAERLDSLMYKTASVTFAGLAMLLITGAIWANESWGHYWQWDSKETGAFVAWLTYGGFLHARISRGLSGRRAAYFAVVAFLLVIFTYLGVSYLLPGLHSYA
jgi:ABC-type transport system involved in cytochrome c biogenesis permease subunit